MAMQEVEMVKYWKWRGGWLKKGQVLQLPQDQARILINHGAARLTEEVAVQAEPERPEPTKRTRRRRKSGTA